MQFGHFFTLALLRQDGGVVAPLIEKIGVPRGALDQQIEAAVARLPKVTGGEVYLGAGLNKALQSAQKEADKLKDDLSAEENLRAALALRAVEADAAKILAALAEVGLERRRHLPARRLSAGQRRRICCPHSSQNLALALFSCWHCGHCICGLLVSGL